jgi:IclR family transcriptional regulator, KDG regulon repressor
MTFQKVTMAINQSLAHGLKVLLLYDGDHPALTAADISKRLRYTQSKTYRMIRTLIQYGFLTESSTTAQYSLGLNALRVGVLAQQSISLPAIARPFMKELSLLTKETVLLTALNGTKAMVLERVESQERIRYSLFQTGADLPLHCGASSKILMAFLPEEEWDQIIAGEGLKEYTPNTITDQDRLKTHLREIRKKGFAFSDQEADRDVRAVAAPVLNGAGQIVAGLSVAGPTYRISKKSLVPLARLVIQFAGRISLQIGRSSDAETRPERPRKRVGARHRGSLGPRRS